MRLVQPARLALFGALVASGALQAGNIVVNGGFETGDFTGWSHQSWEVDSTGDAHPHSGTFSAFTGCVGASCLDSSTPESGAFIFQDLVTTNGQTYTASFFYFPDDGTPNELDVYWNGSIVFTDVDDLGGQNYHQVTINGLQATSGTTRLEFFGRQDPAWLNVDDVCVDVAGAACGGSDVGGVPEPSSLVLAGIGVLGLAVFRRRRA